MKLNKPKASSGQESKQDYSQDGALPFDGEQQQTEDPDIGQDNGFNGTDNQDMGGQGIDNQDMDGEEIENQEISGQDPMLQGQPQNDIDPTQNNTIGGEMNDDSTMSIINQLSDKDKDAVRAYAESMLSRDETQNNNDGQMFESKKYRDVIFKKGQLLEMNENFGPTADELDNTKPKNFSKKTNKNKNTPFNSPKFN